MSYTNAVGEHLILFPCTVDKVSELYNLVVTHFKAPAVERLGKAGVDACLDRIEGISVVGDKDL